MLGAVNQSVRSVLWVGNSTSSNDRRCNMQYVKEDGSRRGLKRIHNLCLCILENQDKWRNKYVPLVEVREPIRKHLKLGPCYPGDNRSTGDFLGGQGLRLTTKGSDSDKRYLIDDAAIDQCKQRINYWKVVVIDLNEYEISDLERDIINYIGLYSVDRISTGVNNITLRNKARDSLMKRNRSIRPIYNPGSIIACYEPNNLYCIIPVPGHRFRYGSDELSDFIEHDAKTLDDKRYGGIGVPNAIYSKLAEAEEKLADYKCNIVQIDRTGDICILSLDKFGEYIVEGKAKPDRMPEMKQPIVYFLPSKYWKFYDKDDPNKAPQSQEEKEEIEAIQELPSDVSQR